MPTGAITGYIDVAQLALYAFWIFFFALIYYLRQEDKREGYPLDSDRTDRSKRVSVQGFPAMPAPKTFLLADGRRVQTPRGEVPDVGAAVRAGGSYPGAPVVPTGNPMLDGVGPASYALRAEEPDRMVDGTVKMMPMRLLPDFGIVRRDPDPRGLPVVAADGRVAGTVRDLWVDRSEPQIRYLEVEVPAGGGSRLVLLPSTFVTYGSRPRAVRVESITAAQFADVPGHKHPDVVTLREEDRICAYYASGHLYATPDRMGPLL